jgi:hypothetical protein
MYVCMHVCMYVYDYDNDDDDDEQRAMYVCRSGWNYIG